MQVPFTAIFLPTGLTYLVEAITDTPKVRYFWVRSKHNVLVNIASTCFDWVGV